MKRKCRQVQMPPSNFHTRADSVHKPGMILGMERYANGIFVAFGKEI